MIITQENAKELVGKKIDSHRRLFGYYPFTVFERDGIYFLKNAVGCCSEIPPERDKFNARHYDFVVEDEV